MKYLRILLFLCVLGCLADPLPAQVINCVGGTASGVETYTGSIFSNYGSVTNAANSKNNITGSLGESFIGPFFGQSYQGSAGFYSRFLLPPSPPVVIASEGDLEDRIQINWTVDPLSPSAESGFNIYRDGAFIDHVEKEIRVYVDFNVQAGKFYTYTVRGVNPFGEGYPGSSLGFLNPNGVVTGQCKTTNGNPVADAGIILMPTLGTALDFPGAALGFVEADPALASGEWTISCWLKAGINNQAYLFDYGAEHGKGWWINVDTDNGTGNQVISLHIGDGNGMKTIAHSLETDPNGWHHLAIAYSGSSALMYVDGVLVRSEPAAYLAVDTLPLFIGAHRIVLQDPTNYFTGQLDDIRLFDRQLPQTEVVQYKNRTINSDAPGLVAYWKFDEGVGSKAYDISPNALRMYLCGAEWTLDHPEIINGAVTDASGFYKIEGINYGSGTTFTAVPSKIVYNNYALEFNAANQQYAVLTDSILFDSFRMALEVRVNNFETTPQPRTILSKGGNFPVNLYVINGIVRLEIGGDDQDFGPLGTGYQHLVFNQNGPVWALYLNGEPVLTNFYSGPNPHADPAPWVIGARYDQGTYDGFFSGLVDEVAFYDAPLDQAQIQLLYAEGVSPQTPGLQSWFALNESTGNQLEDLGLDRTGFGTNHGALWTSETAITDFVAHEFQPDKKLLTLNGTNTSVDQIDFTDLSTIPVSGYVRFDKTFCYADSVEILINGASSIPPIYTNAEGKFVVDFEPGTTATLSPKFKNHAFAPASWEVKKLNAPVAGVLFRDVTKRTIRGQLAGGTYCRYSVLPEGFKAEVSILTLDECYSDTITLTHEENENGRFVFTNVPPVPLNIAIIDHDDPMIKEFFENLGGFRLDLREKNDTIDFVYIAPPSVENEPFSLNECGFVQIEQYDFASTNIRVYEDYYGQRCYLDTFLLTINNNIADVDQYDTMVVSGNLKLKVFGGVPNIVTPHEKTLQVTALVDGRSATSTLNAVVTGERPRVSTFASTTPTFPVMMLRDPPGDNSYAYIEKGTTLCQNWGFELVDDVGGGSAQKVSLGPKFRLGVGVGIWKDEETDVVAETTNQFVITRKQTTSTSTEVCLTTNEVISTSANEDVVGDHGGDVYVGAALNLLFGITDVLKFDTSTCSFALDTFILIHPEKFNSTYLYSEYHIVHTLLPQLLALNDMKSYNAWTDILAQNVKYKKEARFDRNISIDAGVRYEYSAQQDSTSTNVFQFGEDFSQEIQASAGFYWSDVGGQLDMIWQINRSEIESEGSSQASTVKVGYVLEDNDSGDYFSIDIKEDKRFGTPVFKTVAGASSCPWELNTQPREEVSIVVDRNVAVNVPANEPAVFRLTLGNISQSEEGRAYILQTINNSNPDGAVIKVNGQVLTQGIPIFLPFTEGQDFTLTVERGPVKYDYEGLQIAWFSDCEYARSAILDENTDPRFFKAVTLDVHFLEPCSPVDINKPQNGDVITPADNPVLDIRLVDYNEEDPDLVRINTQYRRANTNGAWNNIAETLRADLDPVFEIVPWQTTGLPDGEYEIRAITTCENGLNPGISHVIRITIERTPPELLGTPEPADGVLSAGDEISISFTEDIKCEKIFQADQGGPNNIGLYDTETGDLIDATITCLGNKIVVVPNVPNQQIESKILRVKVRDIQDLAGNTSDSISWEFFVDRGALQLDGGDLNVTLFKGEGRTIYRALQNTGGANASFTVVGAPSWVKVSPGTGSLSPNGEVEVSFKFEPTLPEGVYVDTLFFRNSLGDERVIINLRVLCPAPDWNLDVGAYGHSMTFQVKLDIEGEVSADEADIVAAFIDGELRGRANVEWVPEFGDYRAFLTVYGDEEDQGKPVDLAIWDGSGCLLFNEVIEDFNFEIDGVIGSTGTPEFLHTNNVVLRKIPLKAGWNWISFNLLFPDPTLDAGLGSLKHPENDLIKGQSSFAEYFGSSWIGSLTALDNTGMFQYRADQPDTIALMGGLIDLETTSIPVNAGWNWIGYLPNQPQSVDIALSGLAPLNGDIIKSQTGFAQFLAGTGWIGSLKFMEPPKGYKLKISNPGVITFPQQFAGLPVLARALEPEAEFWMVDPLDYEYSMTMVAMFWDGGENATHADLELGVFDGAEVRGAARAIYVEPIQAYLFFVTIYSNTAGNHLSFKLYDSSTGVITDLMEQVDFVAELHTGSIGAPVALTTGATVTDSPDAFRYAQVRPNPFADELTIAFSTEGVQPVTVAVSDALGRIVYHQRLMSGAGENTIRWDASGMARGIYFVRLDSPHGLSTFKVVHE